MHPLDHVVAYVHGIGVGGQHLHIEVEARGAERRGPPSRAFQQCRTHRLGRAGIEVVHQLLPFDQPVARDEALLHRLPERADRFDAVRFDENGLPV